MVGLAPPEFSIEEQDECLLGLWATAAMDTVANPYERQDHIDRLESQRREREEKRRLLGRNHENREQIIARRNAALIKAADRRRETRKRELMASWETIGQKPSWILTTEAKTIFIEVFGPDAWQKRVSESFANGWQVQEYQCPKRL